MPAIGEINPYETKTLVFVLTSDSNKIFQERRGFGYVGESPLWAAYRFLKEPYITQTDVGGVMVVEKHNIVKAIITDEAHAQSLLSQNPGAADAAT